MSRFAFAAAAVLCVFVATKAEAQAPLDSAFTYQGELVEAGAPATGTYDLRFRLYDEASGGALIGDTLCSDNLAVANGRFAVSLDFGPAAFAGQKRFLQLEVRRDTGLGCSDASGYTVLTSRQELTAAPNASFAQNAASFNGQTAGFYQDAANLTGTLADARLSGNVARLNGNQTFTGQMNFSNAGNTYAGSGAGLTNLNGASINAGTLARSSLSADVQSGVGTLGLDLSLSGSAVTGSGPIFVTVAGSFAYVLNSASDTLQVFNISDPGSPTLTGSVATAREPYSITVAGPFAYVVSFAARTLQVFNMSNPGAPTLVGSVATGSFPRSVAVSGAFAYVVNTDANRLQIFNISNPAAPTLAGSVATDAFPISVAVSGSFAYVVSFNSSTLQVFSISNPATPTLSGSVAIEGFPFSVAVSGSFAYVPAGTLKIFDISNAAAPTLAASVAAGGFPRFVAVSGSFAYVVDADTNTLQAIDISNPASPTPVGSVATEINPFCVAASGSFACVVNIDSNTLQVFNAANGVRFGSTLAPSTLAGVDGSGLTGVNASRLNGQAASFYTNASNITTGTLPAAQVPSLDASKITTGTLANARTTGTNLSTASTLVLRDASGNFSAGTISAALNGNATTATTAANSTQLNGQAASFYTNASNIATGTLRTAVIPVSAWVTESLPTGAISSSGFTEVSGTSRVLSMRQGLAVVSWSISAYSSVAFTDVSVRIRAVTNGTSTFGPTTNFTFNQAGVHTTISGNAAVTIPATANTTFTLEVARTGGTGVFNTDSRDSLTATIINIGQ